MSPVCRLEHVKIRLGITDALSDSLLNLLIDQVSSRFQTETNRVFELQAQTQTFPADHRCLSLIRYPLAAITALEIQDHFAAPWVAAPADITYHLMGSSTVLLSSPVGPFPKLARLTYQGGYVMPGLLPAPGQPMFPADLEHAAIDQVAHLYQLRASVNVFRVETSAGTYWELGDRYWVPWVKAVVRRHRRLVLGQ